MSTVRSILAKLIPPPWRGPAVHIPGRQVLEKKLGHRFADSALLRQALTHRSHVHVTGKERLESNERLEFLGDSVLGMIVNDRLFHTFEEKEEGDLTKIKSLLPLLLTARH